MILVKGIYNVRVNNVFIINVFNSSIKKIKITLCQIISAALCSIQTKKSREKENKN